MHELAPLLGRGAQIKIVNVGPGLAWKRTAPFLSLNAAKRTTFGRMRHRAVRIIDSVARRFLRSGKGLVTFEPLELAEVVAETRGNPGFKIIVVDNKRETGQALKNNPLYKKFSSNLEFVNADVQHESIPKGVDAVFAKAMLSYVDRDAAVKNFSVGLRRGGLLVTDELTREELASFGLIFLKRHGRTFFYLKG